MPMKKTKMSCCYFPSTVMLIDDSQRFLDSLTFVIGDTTLYKLYNKPQQALEYLLGSYHTELSSLFSNAICENDEYAAPTEQQMTVNVANILNEIHNPERFSELTVVVVDYAMPSMNGLELCEKIASLPCKKVLLTGEADHALAVQAFNDGLIDRFIRKDEFNFKNDFNEIIHELQQRYFCELSANTITNLANSRQCCLSDKQYLQVFKDYVAQHAILEYYLLDKNGSYLMLDAKAKPYWLIVRTEQEMETLTEFVTEHDAESTLINALTQREAVPFFGIHPAYWEVDIPQWKDKMLPCSVLETEHGKFYYATAEGIFADELQHEDVVAFEDVLE